jgi:hypothetical protein
MGASKIGLKELFCRQFHWTRKAGFCNSHRRTLGVIAEEQLTFQCVGARGSKRKTQCSIQPVWRSRESGEG